MIYVLEVYCNTSQKCVDHKMKERWDTGNPEV
jgi:hypothetical protein